MMNLRLLFIFVISVLIFEETKANYMKLAEIYIKEATKDDIKIYNNESSLEFSKRVSEFGYKPEEHSVTTDDGYTLTVFRIRDSCKCEHEHEQTPVLFLHGALINGMSWTDAGPSKSLAYILSDRCYDVWIANFRGTKYSRCHKTLKADSEPFWEFSVDEFGQQDVPAIVDHVVEVTGSEQLDIIAYSEGAAAFFIYASTDEKHQQKVRVAIALAPSAYMYNDNNLIFKIIAKQHKAIYKAIQQLMKLNPRPDNVLDMKCGTTLEAGSLCRFLYEKVRDRLPKDALNNLFANFPEPVTKTSFLRYSQHLKKKVFQNADLGKVNNLKKYKSNAPPSYDLGCIKTPVAIIYAENDIIIDKKNMFILKDKLPNVVSFTKAEDPSWTHFDFNLNDNVPSVIAPTVLEVLEGNY